MRVLTAPCRRALYSWHGEQLRRHAMHRKLLYPPSVVFEAVSDVGRYHEFVPFCTRSVIVADHGPDGFDADLSVGFRMFNERYTSRVRTRKDESVTSTLVKSPTFKTLASQWSLKADDNGQTCLLDFSVEFEAGSVLAGHAINAVFPEMARQQMDAFDCRCATIALSESASRVKVVEDGGDQHVEPVPQSREERLEFPSPCVMSLAALFKQYSKPGSGRVLSAVMASSSSLAVTMDADGFQAACAHASRPTGVLANLNSVTSPAVSAPADLGDPSFVSKVFDCLYCDQHGNVSLNDCILAVLTLHGGSSLDRQYFETTASRIISSEELERKLGAIGSSQL